jgi:centromere protein I
VLYHKIFEPVEDAILDDTIESRLAILTLYNNLLRRWGMNLIVANQQSLHNSTAVGSLIDHGNSLALTVLQSSISVSTCSTALAFYETITSLVSQADLRTTIRIATPPAELVYTIYFTLSLSNLTRLCSVLALYKRAFEHATSSKTSDIASQTYPKEYINHFNGFLMDICNCIWRARAFNSSDANALGCLLPAEITSALTKYVSTLDTSLSLAGLFNLSYSPVLCQAAISYVRELEDNEDTIDVRHAGPVTPGSLKQLEIDGGIILSWADYRLGILQYLESNGVSGVGELMYNTMKHLMTARENVA